MTPLQIFAPVRNRDFNSALIARPLTMVIVTSATPLRNFLDRPGRRQAAGRHCGSGQRPGLMVKSSGPMPFDCVAAWAVARRRLNRHEETALICPEWD